MTKVMYRYQSLAKRSWVSDERTELDGMKIELHEYSVRRATLRGVWFYDTWLGKERWVSLHTNKAFAYDTKEKALESFKIRNARHIMHLERGLREAKLARQAADTPALYKEASTFFEELASCDS